MQVSIDSSKYDEHQLFFVRKLNEMVVADLRRAGIDDETGKELAEQVAFTMCCLAGGSTILEMNGTAFRPCLMSSHDEDSTDSRHASRKFRPYMADCIANVARYTTYS